MAHPPLDLHSLPRHDAWRGVGLSFAWPEASVWLRAQLLAERERWLLWLPVAMGMGIALYFGLASEPPVWVGAAGLGLVSLALLWLWRRLPGDQFRGCGPATIWGCSGCTC